MERRSQPPLFSISVMLMGVVLVLWAAQLVSAGGSAQVEAAGTPGHAAAPNPCIPGFLAVSSANNGTGNNYLLAVSAESATDIWAVGYDDTGGSDQTLTKHWNGAGWGVIPSTNPGNYSNYLYGVDAVAANNVWAVGYYYNVTGPRTWAAAVE